MNLKINKTEITLKQTKLKLKINRKASAKFIPCNF